MHTQRRALPLLALLVAATAMPATSVQAQAPPLEAFTATYQVLRGGSAVGSSKVSLARNENGTWTYRSTLKATSGMAAWLGADVSETSHFRHRDDRLEAVGYDYALHSAIKNRQRQLRVDWLQGTVELTTGKGRSFHYKTQPGLVERHLLVLALGRDLAAGAEQMTLPVAVKDRVQKQTYTVRGPASITVPAGTFEAVQVDRTHDDKGWSAWYAATPCPFTPVKLTQEAGGHITMLLEGCRATP